MQKIIKFCLSFFDYFTQKKILIKLKDVFKHKQTISVIDIGAHEGEFISFIIKNFKTSMAYCFEPNPKVFKVLFKKFNNMKNIQLINSGASNITDKIMFNENIESSSSSINDLNKDSNYYKKKFFLLNFLSSNEVTKKIEIKVIQLNEFISKNKIEKIDLLKIDTEGHELQVLQGLKDKINIFNLIHFEHHFDDMIIKNYTLSDIHKLLVNNGFKKIFKIKMKFRKSFEYLYLKR
jgi:FkbM family methyltransferase